MSFEEWAWMGGMTTCFDTVLDAVRSVPLAGVISDHVELLYMGMEIHHSFSG